MSPVRPNSQSRSRSRDPVHVTGRGGWGNIQVGGGGPSEKVIEEMDESERAAHHLAPGLYVLFFKFVNMWGQLTRFFLLGTQPAGVAGQTLALARYRPPRAPVTPTAPIILMRPMSTSSNPPVVAAGEIYPVTIRASPDTGTRTMPRQGF